MQKNKRLLLTAAVSAALLFGMNGYANAYTYSGVTTTVSKVSEDKNNFVAQNGSNITSTGDFSPDTGYKDPDTITTSPKEVTMSLSSDNYSFSAISDEGFDDYVLCNVPSNMPDSIGNELINILINTGSEGDEPLDAFNNKYGTNIFYYIEHDAASPGLTEFYEALASEAWGGVPGHTYYGNDLEELKKYYKYENGKIYRRTNSSGNNWYVARIESTGDSVPNFHYTTDVTTTVPGTWHNTGDAFVTINNAKVTTQKNSATTKAVSVSNNGSLTVSGSADYGSLSVADSNVTVGGNASVSSGGLKTTGKSKVDVSNGTLTVKSGAVNVANGGILKAKVLKAAATNTETSVIGSSTNIQGTLTVAGQIKGVTAGTESTDAVNKGQLDSAVNTLTTKISQGGKTYTAGSDIDISSANAISVKKAGLIASGNTGLVTGGTVYSTTNALNTQITATSQAVESLSDKISTYGKTISSISTSVTNTLSSMKNTQANFVDTSLSNISSDGKDVIKQVVKDVMAANTASTTSSTASAKTANLLKASFVAAPMRAAANLTAGDHVDISGNTISVKTDGTVASGDTGLVTGGIVYNAVKDKADKSYVDEGLARKADISYVDQGLSQKVNVSDFTPVKQQVETNTSDISALKTGKADADGSNINVGSFTAKLNTGKVEKGNTGLVSGGTVYDSLQTKADVGYVNTMGLALDSEIKRTAQGLHNEIQDMGNRLTKDINRVGAGSAALAALHPQDFNPDDKWDFAVGYGHYKNANASAVGAFYRPNAGTTVSLAATIGNGDPQVSASVSFKIGMGKNVEKVMVNKDDYDKLNRKVENQDEEINEQKNEILMLKEQVEKLIQAVNK